MQELVVVTRFFSGIEDILTTGHWGHSGSPAYYHFIRKLDLREDIDYKFFLLSPKLIGNNRKKIIVFDNLDVVANIVPYYPIFFSEYISFIKKIEFFYNKIRQYIFVLSRAYQANNYYIDRDNILFTFILLAISRSNIVITRLLGVPENMYKHLTYRGNIYSKIIRWVFNHNRAYFVCTNDGSYAEKISKKFGGDRFYLLFNGVDKNLISIPKVFKNKEFPKITKIAYVSRIVPGKGHVDIIEVLRKINTKNSVVVYMIGDGKLEDKCKKLVKKYRLDDNILFLGKLSHKNTIEYISRSDIFISINYDGSFGNGVLEAATLGLPIVTLKHKGVLSKEYCQFFKFIENNEKTKRDLEKFLEDFMSHKLLRQIMSKNSIEFSKRYLIDWEDRVDSEIDSIVSICT